MRSILSPLRFSGLRNTFSSAARSLRIALTSGPAVWRERPERGWRQIDQGLQTRKDLTLQRVWQEACENNLEGYSYSRFCDLYRRWLKKLDLGLRQERRAREKTFVDYAGATIPIDDLKTGEATLGRIWGNGSAQQHGWRS